MAFVVLILGVLFLLLQFGEEASDMMGGCCLWSLVAIVVVVILLALLGWAAEKNGGK